jgi:hypothetical protein
MTKLNPNFKHYTAWCQKCWWKSTGEYHVEVSKDDVYRAFKSLHRRETEKHCDGVIRLEYAASDSIPLQK